MQRFTAAQVGLPEHLQILPHAAPAPRTSSEIENYFKPDTGAPGGELVRVELRAIRQLYDTSPDLGCILYRV